MSNVVGKIQTKEDAQSKVAKIFDLQETACVNNIPLPPTVVFPCIMSSIPTAGFELFHTSVFLRKSV